jgi:hypothetical protein
MSYDMIRTYHIHDFGYCSYTGGRTEYDYCSSSPAYLYRDIVPDLSNEHTVIGFRLIDSRVVKLTLSAGTPT